MGIPRKLKIAAVISVICLLVVALAALSAVIILKNKEIIDFKAEVARNEAIITENGTTVADLQKENKTIKEQNEQIKGELESAKQENDKLKSENKKYLDENNKLKSEIATLKAQKNTGNKVCYLTFDDGPSENTLGILKVLKKYNAKATFFVINTSKFDYVKQIHADGHTVGLHTDSHVYSSIYSSIDAYFADLNSISNRVEKLTGVKSTVMRFPGGSSNGISKKHCPGIMSKLVNEVPARGYSYFDWNVDSGDADSNTPSYTYILNRVLQGASGKNAICVLMHDASAKTTTVQALPYIIEGLAQRGYRFEALTTATMAPGFRHNILHN